MLCFDASNVVCYLPLSNVSLTWNLDDNIDEKLMNFTLFRDKCISEYLCKKFFIDTYYVSVRV